MDDIKYVYTHDILDKKQVARGASHKNVKRKAYFKVPSKKEIKKMSSPITSVNVKQKIEYREFKKLPKTLKEVYVKHIVETYHVGGSAFVKMWDASVSTVYRALSRLDIALPERTHKADLQRFIADYIDPKPQLIDPKPQTIESNGSLEGVSVVSITLTFSDGSTCIVNNINANMKFLFNMLK